MPRSYEGANCVIDVNECVRGLDDCDSEWGGSRGPAPQLQEAYSWGQPARRSPACPELQPGQLILSSLCLPATPRTVNAACINTAGGFTCECFLAYTGDGRTCTEIPGEIAAIRGLFITNFKVSNWPTSAPVAYPVNAPGFAYDPTGALRCGGRLAG